MHEPALTNAAEPLVIQPPSAVRGPGTLTIHCPIDRTRELWATVTGPDETLERIAVSVDPFLSMALVLASLEGRDLRIEADLDPLLRANLSLNLAPLVARFFRSRLVQVMADGARYSGPTSGIPEDPAAQARQRGVGHLFSGGVDSYYSVMRLRETALAVDHLVNVNAGSNGNDRACWRNRFARVSEIAEESGLVAVGVDTNFHEIVHLAHPAVHTIRDLGAASVLAGAIDTFIYSSGNAFSTISFETAAREQIIAKIDHTVLGCIAPRQLNFVEFGFEVDRIEKTRALADYAPCHRHLDVCTNGRYQARNERGSPVNCGRCLKCIRTMTTLDRVGKLDRFSTQFDVADSEQHRRQRWTQLAASGLELDRDVVRWVNTLAPARAPFRGLLRRVPRLARVPRLSVASDGPSDGHARVGPPIVISEPSVVRHPGSIAVSCRLDEQRALTATLTGPEAALSRVTVTADAFAAIALLVANLEGRSVRIDARLDPLLQANLALAFAPLVAQIYGSPPPTLVPAPLVEPQPQPERGGRVEITRDRPAVGLLFSGGVDSFHALIRVQEAGLPVDYLVNVNAGANGNYVNCWHQRNARVTAAGLELGIPTIRIDTNFHELVRLPHLRVHAVRNISAATLLRGAVDVLAYAATETFEDISFPTGTASDAFGSFDHTVTASFGQAALSVLHVGWDTSRIDRTIAVAANRMSHTYLDVCTDGAYQDVVDPSRPINCGRCRKCIRTLATLEAIGRLEDFSTQFDVGAFRMHRRSLLERLAASDDRLDLAALRLAGR